MDEVGQLTKSRFTSEPHIPLVAYAFISIFKQTLTHKLLELIITRALPDPESDEESRNYGIARELYLVFYGRIRYNDILD
jgi:hypothetical protein